VGPVNATSTRTYDAPRAGGPVDAKA